LANAEKEFLSEKIRDGVDAVARTRGACATQSSGIGTKMNTMAFIR
jgi:hypothetical protein